MIEKIIDYIVGNPRKMLIISLLLLAFGVLFLGFKYFQTGEIVERSIDFKSGTQIAIEFSGDVDIGYVTGIVQSKFGTSTGVRLLGGVTNTLVIETDREVTSDEIDVLVLELGIDVVGKSSQSIGAALGQAFWNQALTAIVVAFIAMAIVVFITFRDFVPSVAVILAGVSDITLAVVGMNLLGIQLSMGTLAGLLILMGYSIDTDILLSTRVIKRRGENTLDDRIKSSMKTGITMSVTSIVAMAILFLVSSSPVLDDIALVIILGLLADIPFTWLQNVGILKLYMENKEMTKR
ncbi:MAG: protein translocase subunit SecF [archaeon]